jgi:hypothetical protein
MVKLYGEHIASVSLPDGGEIRAGEDGAFEVPAEDAARLCEAFGLRTSPDAAPPPRDPVPAVEVDKLLAELREARASRDRLVEDVKALTAQNAALAAQIEEFTAPAPEGKKRGR